MDLKSIVITVVLLMAAYATFMCEGLPGTTTNPKPINTNTSSAAAQQNGAANATATTSTDAANLLTDAMQKCNQTNPISMEYLNELNTTGSFPDETDKGPMCYIRCYLQTVGILKQDNTVDKDRAASMLWSNSMDAIDDCMNDQDGLFDKDANKACENAYYLTRCVMIKELLTTRGNEATA